jgi:hypothetical protein
MSEEKIQEIFNELEEDTGRLYALVRMIKLDLILKNTDRAKAGLETSLFLAQRIQANLYSLYVTKEKRESRIE